MLVVDEDALRTVEHVKAAKRSLSQEEGSVGDIFLLFAHDLLIHFSGIVLHRDTKDEYLDSVDFPYVTKQYSLHPHAVGDIGERRLPGRADIKALIRQLSLSNVAIGHAVPIDLRGEWFVGKWMNFFAAQKPPVRAFLPQRDLQIEAFRDLIEVLCEEFEVSEVEKVWDNWYRYLQIHTTDEQPVISEHAVILGTRNHLQNRKLAINYLQQGKEVVAVTHGEVANSVMDEPPFGYSERTLCSVLVDYGDFDKDGNFNSPWVLPRRRIYRSSVLAKYAYRSTRAVTWPKRKNLRGLYIPTTYHGNKLYGPFHAFEDLVYRNWQSFLFDSIEGLTFKVHPKSQSEPLEGVSVEKRSLETCINNYDYLVFDYFATGALLGLVSDKPVIYCDIGLRNLHPEFLEDLKKRCEYVKIDLKEFDQKLLGERLREILLSSRSFSNEEMRKYVFCESDEFSWKGIFWQMNFGKQISLG